MVLFKFSRSVAVVGSSLILLAGCGSKLSKDKDTKNDASTETIDVKVGLQFTGSAVANLNGFDLADNITDYVIDVAGCKSGYTKNVVSSAATPVSTVALYAFDVDCLAALKSFSYGGSSYARADGSGLSAGSAVFQNAGNTKQLTVSVFEQLPSPLVNGAKASFAFQEILLGSDYTISNYSTYESLGISGTLAPAIKIPVGGVALKSISAANGAATFDVKVECESLLANTNECPTSNGNQSMLNMKAKLVTDTYSGVVSLAQAGTIMASGASSVVAGDVQAPVGAYNGGFKLDLAGSGALASNKNMLLVIEWTDPADAAKKSYRYFNVDIGDPQ